ncbi:vacuolar protein sorting-associated protein 37C-like isoform X2 [Arapaima gigas]
MMDKLDELSQAELEELLDNAERVQTLALESDEVQNIQLEREMALASNRSLAEQNLELKPQLEEGRGHLVERYTELQRLRTVYEQHCTQRDSIMGQVSPEGLFSQLQTESANIEAESEDLADCFLDGSLPLDTFLERFLSLRSLAHKRRVCMDKLQEVLRQKMCNVPDPAGPPLGKMALPPCTDQQAGGGAPLPWQPQTGQSKEQGANGNVSQPQPSPGLPPYVPYPISPAGPANTPAPFPVYSSPGHPFPPGGVPSCPYPAQPPFPFGRFAVPPPPVAYPSAHPYTNYSFPPVPGLPPSQPPPGQPVFRPGFGVPFS